MKKLLILALSVLTASLYLFGAAYASGPTKDILQPAQGLGVAQEACSKYAGDDTREIACVLFHAGAVKKVNGKYQINVQLLEPVAGSGSRTPGHLVKCKAELVYLQDGGIGWRETSDCR